MLTTLRIVVIMVNRVVVWSTVTLTNCTRAITILFRSAAKRNKGRLKWQIRIAPCNPQALHSF